MSLGQIRTRECRVREVISTVLGRNRATAPTGNVISGTATGIITGGHGLLKFGIYVVFVPKSAMPAAAEYAGMTFAIYGWIANANGKYVRASETPINGAAGTQIPDGWEGQSTLAMYEVQATLGALQPNQEEGEWTLIVVCEPGEGCSCEMFDELVERVTVRFDGNEPLQTGLTG